MWDLFHVTQHDSLAKWEKVTLVKYWQLANCHLYKLETTFLERVELVPEPARCIEFLRKEIKKFQLNKECKKNLPTIANYFLNFFSSVERSKTSS